VLILFVSVPVEHLTTRLYAVPSELEVGMKFKAVSPAAAMLRQLDSATTPAARARALVSAFALPPAGQAAVVAHSLRLAKSE